MEIRKVCMRCGSTFAAEAEFCPHDGNKLIVDHEVPDPLLGTTLLEQFEIRAIVGSGGMGTVYRAHQTTTDRDVAIKVLRPELAQDQEAVLRFKREARVATRLDHPNLVNVFLSGQLPDGRLYIVMELLDGRSLADVLDETPVLELERALKILLKLGAGVGAMHAQDVIHRDIKPENVFLVNRGADPEFAKLVDFGIARNLESGFTSTKNGRVFGTANYISPEAAAGENVDQRSDIYSLGVLAYQLFTGVLPFDGETAGAVLLKHVNNPAPHIHTRGQGERVPHELADVVMSALQKDPAERPQTIGQFIESFATAATHTGVLSDVHSLLLGTMWHDEMTSPGTSLAQILGANGNGTGSSPKPQLELAEHDEEPYALDPLSESDEAFLSSAPDPFGTETMGLQVPRRRSQSRVLWTVLGGLVLVTSGAVAFSWWSTRTPTAAADGATDADPEATDTPSVPAEAIDSPTEPPEPDVSLGDSIALAEPDVKTDSPKAPAPPRVTPATKPKTRSKPTAPRRNTKPKPSTSTPKPPVAPPAVTPPATPAPTEPAPPSSSPPAAEPPTTAEPPPSTEPKEPAPDEGGIDWTLPDIPETDEPPTNDAKEPAPAPAPAPEPADPPASDDSDKKEPPTVIEDPPFVLPPP